jgi:signal transduction histidine kinase
VRDERAEPRASRARLVLAADAERRDLERELHEVVQQHFVALGVGLQLVSQAMDADPAAAKELLASLGRDVRGAIADTSKLAERIHPPLLEVDLAVALRSALSAAAIPVTVDVPAGTAYPQHVALTCYLACLGAVARTDGAERAAVAVREEDGRVRLEVVLAGAPTPPELGSLADRVEALDGELAVSSGDGEIRVLASLPVSR